MNDPEIRDGERVPIPSPKECDSSRTRKRTALAVKLARILVPLWLLYFAAKSLLAWLYAPGVLPSSMAVDIFGLITILLCLALLAFRHRRNLITLLMATLSFWLLPATLANLEHRPFWIWNFNTKCLAALYLIIVASLVARPAWKRLRRQSHRRISA